MARYWSRAWAMPPPHGSGPTSRAGGHPPRAEPQSDLGLQIAGLRRLLRWLGQATFEACAGFDVIGEGALFPFARSDTSARLLETKKEVSYQYQKQIDATSA